MSLEGDIDEDSWTPFIEEFDGSQVCPATSKLCNFEDLSSISQSGTRVSVDLSFMPPILLFLLIISLLTASTARLMAFEGPSEDLFDLP